jgi:Family of unknown function (DUF5670)
MKKLLVTLIPCILACILLSSCGGSRISIAKRHYRGGYYVDYVKKAPSVTRTANETTKTGSHQQVSIESLPYPEKHSMIKGIFHEGDQINTPGIIAMPQYVKNKIFHAAANTKQVVAQGNSITTAPTTEMKLNQSEESIGSAGHDGDGAGAALSLLWIVIVIILIIWLIGILAGNFGLGGLINLLLLIALILLILWLLRIA